MVLSYFPFAQAKHNLSRGVICADGGDTIKGTCQLLLKLAHCIMQSKNNGISASCSVSYWYFGIKWLVMPIGHHRRQKLYKGTTEILVCMSRGCSQIITSRCITASHSSHDTDYLLTSSIVYSQSRCLSPNPFNRENINHRLSINYWNSIWISLALFKGRQRFIVSCRGSLRWLWWQS